MADDLDDGRIGGRRSDPPLPDEEHELTASIVEYGVRPTECTLYPRDVPEGSRGGAWITAREGSFVDLESCR